jgi:hypothetical protein
MKNTTNVLLISTYKRAIKKRNKTLGYYFIHESIKNKTTIHPTPTSDPKRVL